VKIHYKGFHGKFDEWIDRDSNRIRPYGRSKVLTQKHSTMKQWKVPLGKNYNTNSANNSNTVNNNSNYGKFNDEHNKENNNSVLSPNNSKQNNSSLSRVFEESKGGPPGYLEERTRKIAELSDHFTRYTRALGEHNLRVFPVSGDGNCLFRSVAHQIYGDDRLHMLVRQKCVDYMESEAEFFCQFVEGGRESFPYYLQAKRTDACWGDDPEIEVFYFSTQFFHFIE
jgi:hypothetical protein